MVHYLHAPYVQHSTQLLPDAKLPPREVQDFAIYHINRRMFRGEEAIKIVEKVLGVDASADPIYNFSSAQNRSGQHYGGYQNNRGVYNSSVAEQSQMLNHYNTRPSNQQLGQRRNYQQYVQNQSDRKTYDSMYN